MANLFDDDFDDFETFITEENEDEAKERIVDALKEALEDEPLKVEDMSDEDVNDVFNDIVDSAESDEMVIEASAAIIAAEAAVAEAQRRIAQEDARLAEIDEQRAALEKQLSALISEKSKIQSDTYYVRAEVRKKSREVEDKKRAKDEAVKAFNTRQAQRVQSASFVELARDKAWWQGISMDNGDVFKVMDHQWTGSQFLATAKRAILGDGMGLGKTLTAIAAMDIAQAKKVLIIAQSDIASNFEAEVRMWAPHRNVVKIQGKTKKQRDMILSTAQTFMTEFTVLVNFEAWRRDHGLLTQLANTGFDTVIVDEAHNIKTTKTDAYKGVKDIVLSVNYCPHCDRTIVETRQGRRCSMCGWQGQAFDFYNTDGTLADERERYFAVRSVKNVWFMTGTPVLNSPVDLFSLLSIVDPIAYHTKNNFLASFCEVNRYTGKWGFAPGGLERLIKRLSGRYLARSLEDAGITLPPQLPIFHEIEMDRVNYADQAMVIDQLADHAQIVLSSGAAMSSIATIALITRQRQANVWVGGIKWTETDPETGIERLVRVSEEITQSIKMDKAVEIIRQYASQGHRIALFSQFKESLIELERRVNGLELDNGEAVRAVRFDGDTPRSVREEIKTNFDRKRGEESKWDVVLAHYKVGGTGLNLTNVTHTIILDEEWNPGKRDQSYARTRRIGQTESTFVHVLRLMGTVDDWLAGLIESKEKMIDGFNNEAMDMQDAYLKAFAEGRIKPKG